MGYLVFVKYVVCGKQYFVMLCLYQNGLLMQQLYYVDEVKVFDQVLLGEEIEFKEGEFDFVIQFIEQIVVEDFKLEQYLDDVCECVWLMIQQWVEGQEVVEVEEEVLKVQIIDFMEVFKVSFGEDGDEGKLKKVIKCKLVKCFL